MSPGIAKNLSSSIGKKLIMALSGLLLIAFLIAHLLGNLTLFADPDGGAFNAYAEKLRDMGPLLIVAELGLVALFGVHIAMALRVSMENREARKQGYVIRSNRGRKTLGSSSMLITGIAVFAFLLIHLKDFRFAHWFGGDFEADPAGLVKETLATPVHALLYVAALAFLTIHLTHAFQSALQTLGVNHPRLVGPIRMIGLVLALVLGIGFATMPLYYLIFWSGGAQG